MRRKWKEIMMEWDFYKYCCGLEGNVKIRWYHFITFLYTGFKFWILSLVCKVKGHDIEMDGWCTPNTGGESWECKRCGWGGSHTYY